MKPHKPKLVRFDLLLPPATVEVIKENAAIRGISPRTMGRVLIVEKIKDLIRLEEAQHKKNGRTKLLECFWGIARTALLELFSWMLRELTVLVLLWVLQTA